MKRFTAFWDESFDGLSNYGVLIVSAVNPKDDEHPLVGQWNSSEQLHEAAAKVGVDPSEIEIDE